ncbi:hypothetical protein E2605_16745 [Dysgonomonas capnocytophagoides]|uniref:Uncharacterized protein n=1 Tax=Dysgonomonas capnocytophagoides TaxID=45254 RepID=A0A4Y8KVS4_9BACT|nr:hypothetical protein [Dysgonomonas capnocytophagoides]TFD93796.1 hypothetical protein E2605_16745 [Dysgonomonas capnocytophagoides]
MEEKKKKTFVIEINGVKESIENVEKLADALDKLDLKVKNSNTSKAIAVAFDDLLPSLTNIEGLLKKIVAIISKTQPLIETTIKAINITERIDKEAKKASKDVQTGLTKTIKEKDESQPSSQQKGKNANDFIKDITKINTNPKDDNAPQTDPIKNHNGTTNVDATRAQIEFSQKQIAEFRKTLEKTNKAATVFFAETEANYKTLLGDHLDTLVNLDKESKEYNNLSEDQKKSLEGYKNFLEEKDKYNREYLKKKNDVHVLEEKAQETSNKIMLKGFTQTLEQIQLQWERYGTQLQTLAANYTALMGASAELYKAKAAEAGKSIAAIDEQLKASTEKRKALDEESKTATGGRIIVIEELKAREIAASQELTAQKKEEETEKARLEKEAEKRTKRAQRLNLAMSIPKTIADVAKGIASALSLGLVGIPIAAIIAAQGAIQIATVKKQYDKINMESGGLLIGKRHTQGGMRIEGSNIEVEGDEFVVNRISTRKNLGLVDYINRERRALTAEDLTGYFSRSRGQNFPRIESKRIYESGGQLTNLEVVDSVTAPEINKILDAISNIDFRPVVSVTDIADAQRTMVSVERTVNS